VLKPAFNPATGLAHPTFVPNRVRIPIKALVNRPKQPYQAWRPRCKSLNVAPSTKSPASPGAVVPPRPLNQ